VILELRFKQGSKTSSVYRKIVNSCLRFVTVCENDLFVTETEEKFAEDFITEIALKFDMSDLEENGMENYKLKRKR